jgi:hypothetical protein
MNKKELTQKVSQEAAVLHRAQLRPNTFYSLTYDGYIGVGFAKIHGNDKWGSQYGYDLARRKAVAHIVRQVLGKEAKYGGAI